MSNNALPILKNHVDAEPTGVIYAIRCSDIEKFVKGYLIDKGIDGVEAVVSKIKRDGNINPQMALYLFVNTNSDDLDSSAKNIPAVVRNRMEHIDINMKDKMKKVLYPLCGSEIKSGRQNNQICWIRLNVLRVVGLMFAAEPKAHRITIAAIGKIPASKDGIVTVIKEMKYDRGNNDSSDRFAHMIDDIEND